jgi:arylsulfatase A-like enzyme
MSQFNRAFVTGRVLFASVFAACGLAVAAEVPHPNILVIVSDDQGYADTGFQGCKDIPTPHLDRLAKSGLRCTDGYVSHPFCSPTRAGLMTGRYQQRFGHENNPFYDPESHIEGLPTSQKLLPEYLKAAGYVTGWIGKWHLGAAAEFRPINRGFSETFGFIGGGHQYQGWNPNVKGEYLVPIERNGKPVEVTNHLTVAFGHEAADFVARHKTEPWFLYLAFNAPHTPLQPTEERLAKFAAIEDVKRRKYAAQVSLLDDAIGEALAALHETGQDNRTLVFFFSDNGGPIGPTGNGSINSPLRAGKGTVYEGGVRVPFVVSWPGKIPGGKDYGKTVCSLDVFATALAVAGVPMPTDKKYDSVNLVPYLTGENAGVPNNRLFWRSGKQSAAHDGAEKLVRHGGQSDELYDLAADLSETKDLATSKADDAKKLGEILDGWDKELIPPSFPGLGRGKKEK